MDDIAVESCDGELFTVEAARTQARRYFLAGWALLPLFWGVNAWLHWPSLAGGGGGGGGGSGPPPDPVVRRCEAPRGGAGGEEGAGGRASAFGAHCEAHSTPQDAPARPPRRRRAPVGAVLLRVERALPILVAGLRHRRARAAGGRAACTPRCDADGHMGRPHGRRVSGA